MYCDTPLCAADRGSVGHYPQRGHDRFLEKSYGRVEKVYRIRLHCFHLRGIFCCCTICIPLHVPDD